MLVVPVCVSRTRGTNELSHREIAANHSQPVTPETRILFFPQLLTMVLRTPVLAYRIVVALQMPLIAISQQANGYNANQLTLILHKADVTHRHENYT